MKHTFIIEIETSAISAEDTVRIQQELISALEYEAASLGIKRINATWYQSQRGYIVNSGEATSDIVAPNSPDMRYQS